MGVFKLIKWNVTDLTKKLLKHKNSNDIRFHVNHMFFFRLFLKVANQDYS